MEQHKRSKTVFKFLKAASSINFNNPPFSPTRESTTTKLQPSSDHNKLHHYNGFVSAPILPPRAKQLRQKKHKKFAVTGESPAAVTSDDVHEPTSPKISCIGQIKHKKCMLPKQPAPLTKANDNKKSKKTTKENQNPKPESPGIWKLFGAASFKKLGPSSAPARRKRSNSTSAVAGARLFVDESEGQPLPDRAPCLSQMRRFASGHGDGLRDFDWTGQIAGLESNGAYYSDEEEEIGGYSDDEMEAKEVIVPYSVQMWVGGDVEGRRLQPRKEVNLWKRRTIDPPRPLQLVGSY